MKTGNMISRSLSMYLLLNNRSQIEKFLKKKAIYIPVCFIISYFLDRCPNSFLMSVIFYKYFITFLNAMHDISIPPEAVVSGLF